VQEWSKSPLKSCAKGFNVEVELSHLCSKLVKKFFVRFASFCIVICGFAIMLQGVLIPYIHTKKEKFEGHKNEN